MSQEYHKKNKKKISKLATAMSGRKTMSCLRENLLYTFIDYYEDKFGRWSTLKIQEEFAKIISWNIFQMDGLRYVVPMSCHHENKIIPGVRTLFEEIPEKIEKHECERCKYNHPNKHNGRYVKIMDWSKNKAVRFVDLINRH